MVARFHGEFCDAAHARPLHRTQVAGRPFVSVLMTYNRGEAVGHLKLPRPGHPRKNKNQRVGQPPLARLVESADTNAELL